MTYEQINEMMQEMGCPLPIIILQRVNLLNRLFCCFYPPERIHFRRITPCISALRCWILNSIQM